MACANYFISMEAESLKEERILVDKTRVQLVGGVKGKI